MTIKEKKNASKGDLEMRYSNENTKNTKTRKEATPVPALLLCLALSASVPSCNPSGRAQPSGDAARPDVHSIVDVLLIDPDTGFEWPDTGIRPQGRFAEIWNEMGAGQGDLGYPTVEELTDASCAWQPFQSGWMIWLEARAMAEGCQEFCDLARIFSVVYPGANPQAVSGDLYYKHPDDWTEEMDEFSCPEADRTLATVGNETKAIGPIRGFGRVWCTDTAVRTSISTALAPERGGPYFLSCSSQLFQGGLVVYNPNEEDKSYWVFLTNWTWRRFPE